MDAEEKATVDRWRTAPAPDHPAKPRWPWQLSGRAWRYVVRRTWAEFWYDHILDNAGSLTYMAMQSLFPALLAMISMLSVFGRGDEAVEWMITFLGRSAPEVVVELLSEPLRQLSSVAGAGWVLAFSLLAAMWGASGYVGAFGRTVNRIYGVVEGRPIWKIIPYNFLVTMIMVGFGSFVVLTVLLSAAIWDTVLAYLGLGVEPLYGLRQNRWVLLGGASLVAILALFRTTPNVRQARLRWTLPGALLALVLTFVAILGFSAWVAAFPTLNTTYGVIGSFIILMLGLWLTNVAMLLGVEVNAEIERARLLAADFPAEEELLVPPRDTRMIRARVAEEERLYRAATALRPGRLPPPAVPGPRPERDDPAG